MIVTGNGNVDILHVANSTEAEELLNDLYDRTSLSKKEITSIVSLSGLSVSDTVKVYNRFTREGQVIGRGQIRPLAA